MPKSLLDWLGVVTLWVGAIVLAFKSADAPLANGAPTILASHFWNFVPGLFVTLAVLIFIYRQIIPLTPGSEPARPPTEQRTPTEKSVASLLVRSTQRPTILYGAKVAARSARSAMADNPSYRTAQKQLPPIMATALTLTKNFEVAFPQPTGRANLNLEAYLGVIEEMLPYLSAGHDEEAREVGKKWINQLDKPK